MMKILLCAFSALLPFIVNVMAEEDDKTASVTLKVEVNDNSMKVLEGVRSLNRKERDLIEAMAAEDRPRDVEPVRPKREAPANPLLAFFQPKTTQKKEKKPTKKAKLSKIERRRKRLQRLRKARKANRARRNKHRRAVAKARRQAKARLRARLIRRIQRARIQRSKQRANEAKLADQLSRE